MSILSCLFSRSNVDRGVALLVLISFVFIVSVLFFTGDARRKAEVPKQTENRNAPDPARKPLDKAKEPGDTAKDPDKKADEQAWAKVVLWTHSWDMQDITTYEDDGKVWSIPAATRVDTVADRGTNNVPLKRDTGPWGKAMKQPPIPGPTVVNKSKRFNGRQAIFNDPVGKGTFGTLAAMLSTTADPADKSTWFNDSKGYDTPYWGVVLCRPANGQLQNFCAWDSYNGHLGTTATMGKAPGPPKKTPCWGMTTSLGRKDPWPATKIEGSDEQTVLVIGKVDGADSFMEINWRDAEGKPKTDRTKFKLTNYPAKEIFFGYVHVSYVSAVGFKTGAPTEEEVDAVRAWASPWLPSTGPLPVEP